MMKEQKQKKVAIGKVMVKLGSLIENFRSDTGTTYDSLNQETGLHYNTCKRIVEGCPTLQAQNLLLLLAELMQRDRHGAADRFFAAFRSLLDDAFDEN